MRANSLLKKSLRLRKRVGGREISRLGWVHPEEWASALGHIRFLLTLLDTARPSSQELGQANETVGEHGVDLVEVAHLQLPEPTHRLAPAEAFLNALAQPLADRIAQARRDLARDGDLARLCRSCSPSR